MLINILLGTLQRRKSGSSSLTLVARNVVVVIVVDRFIGRNVERGGNVGKIAARALSNALTVRGL